MKRAMTVRDYLITRGVPASSIDVAGLGSATPLGDNTTVDGRARNRRVEIVLTRRTTRREISIERRTPRKAERRDREIAPFSFYQTPPATTVIHTRRSDLVESRSRPSRKEL